MFLNRKTLYTQLGFTLYSGKVDQQHVVNGEAMKLSPLWKPRICTKLALSIQRHVLMDAVTAWNKWIQYCALLTALVSSNETTQINTKIKHFFFAVSCRQLSCSNSSKSTHWKRHRACSRRLHMHEGTMRLRRKNQQVAKGTRRKEEEAGQGFKQQDYKRQLRERYDRVAGWGRSEFEPPCR